MPECSIDRDSIKTGIQNSVAKSLDASGLFDRVSPFADTVQRIQEALKYADDVTNTYRSSFKSNPEDFLRDIAKQATGSESEQQGALTTAGYKLFDIALEMYGEGYLFAPKITNVPFKDIIESINANFGEEVIKEVEQNGDIVYSTIPSEALINAYEREYKGEETVYDFSRKPGIKPPVPNVKSRAWKDLSKKIGPAAAYDAYIRNGYIIPVAATFEDSFRGIDASLKVIAALEKIQRGSYPSNQAEGFFNDLRKQGAPENQIDLVKNYINRHNIKEINRVDLIAGLLTEISYTVQINTAMSMKSGQYSQDASVESFTLGNSHYNILVNFDDDHNITGESYFKDDIEIPEKIYREDYKKATNVLLPTQHYNSLTVPGGTNYRENEFAIPGVETQQGPEGSEPVTGVDVVFAESPALAAYGTKEQYSEYLLTIFPNSQYQQIVYRGTDASDITSTSPNSGGIWFADTSENVTKFLRAMNRGNGIQPVPAILNMENPREYEDFWNDFTDEMLAIAMEGFPVGSRAENKRRLISNGYDSMHIGEDTWNDADPEDMVTGEQWVVFKPDQIHILGSATDVDRFKKWIAKNTTTVRKGAIVPATKGHAAFSTIYGAGWFRSDDKAINTIDKEFVDQTNADVELDDNFRPIRFHGGIDSIRTLSGIATKIRRILEIQSDLFQKMRGKIDLVTPMIHDADFEYQGARYSVFVSVQQGNQFLKDGVPITPDEFMNAQIAYQDNINTSPENQFLQVLMKDNNWVTFFVKSIIQDSAKKGYEKVWFPTGNTANKVEGQQTVEEYIKSKEKRIAELNSISMHKWIYDDVNKQYEVTEPSQGATIAVVDTQKEAEEIYDKKYGERRQREIEQLEREIKDAKEGRSKFTIINAFYETQIYNILKKQGYNPVRITDEYGNQWFEVDLRNTDYANERVLYGLGDIVQNDMNYSLDDIYEELGLTETSTPQDFIEAHMKDYAANIANFRKFNPNFKIEWGTERTQFDFTTNTIYLDLHQLNTIAKANNVPLSQVVSILMLHEMGHAASYYGLETGKNDQVLNKLMEVAKNHHKTNVQFEDVLRQGFTEPDGSIYAFKDIHEFAAEAYSNPYFQEWLKSIPYEGKKNLLEAIWDAILEFFGVVKEKPTLYDAVIEYLNSDLIQRDNREGSEHPSTEWDLTVTYKEGVGAKATPKTYSEAAFELFTNPAITDEITTIVKGLPKALIEIKKQLDYETDRDKIKKLKSLLDAYKDVKENENVLKVSINMLIQAGFIAEDMERQLVELKALKDNSKKITLAHSLRNNIQALEFIEPLAQDVVRLILREGDTAAIRPFLRVLRGITSTMNSVKKTYVDVTQPAVLEVLSGFVGETEAEKTINQTLISLRERLKNSKDPVMQGLLDRQIKLEEEKLKLVPNKANFDLIFQGLYKDSSSSQLLFEAGMANGHPIPNTVMKILRQNNIAVSQTMLHVENEHQKQLDKLRAAMGISAIQGIRNTETFYEPITMLVSRADEAVEGADGVITYKYTTSKMLLSEYSPEYIKEGTQFKALIDFYSRKLYEADDKEDAEAVANYRDKLNKAYKDRRKFNRENSENQYSDKILDMYDMLEKEIVKPDGTTTTFGAERGYIFEAIEDAEQRRQEEFNLEVLAKLQDEIEGLYIKQKQLKSKYNEDGSEKTGFEKELSDIANTYAELKTEYGKYELTEKGQAMFEKELLSLQKRLEGGFITQEEYERRLGEITVTELTEDYYVTVKYYLELINEASEALADIDEFKSIFKGVNREAIKAGYDKIRDLVRGFRDNEMTIDGQLFSKVRPELVKEIQKIQQEVENLKGISEKLRGLSIEDAIRAKELRGKKVNAVITEDELAELNELDAKILESDRLYLKYKDLVDNYSDLLKEFSELNESTPSQYYQDELEVQKAKLVSEKTVKILEQLKTSDSMQEGKYIKEKGVWVEFGRMQGTTKVVKDIDKAGFKTVEDALADKIAREQTEDDIKLTDWWKENHYEKYRWSKKKGYVKSDSPIYIWVKTEPADREFIKEQQPSIKFKTYTINPEHHNPNFRLINDNLPAPKSGRYINRKYNDLKSSTDSKMKAYSEYLEFARDAFVKAQAYVPEERRLADILPSLVKTADEISVDITNTVANGAMKILQRDASLGILASETLDEQTMTSGGTTDFFAKNRVLPVRFSSRIDHKDQSSDIPAMLLAYQLAAVEYNEQLKDQPLLEAIRTAVENLPVLESKRLASQFSVANLFSAIKSSFTHGDKSQTTEREKKVVKSNLSKTVDHMLDTYLYGETKKSANVAIMGMDFDLHKASTGLKKISSLSIFALNAFVAVKNSVSATIQGNINSNIGKGFFTKAQYNRAHLEAIGHVKDYLLDFRKFGNKTLIGQEIDFFQVLQGAAYNQYGQKTAWTVLKNGQNFLTSLKNSSEFELQITQYLAMSKANPVEVNGKMVEFRKAFQLDSNMNLVPVAGANVTQKQIEDFIFKLGFVNRAINGAYRAEEKNAIQKNILGDLVFYLNGYVVPGIVNRFGKTRYSAEADMITRGYINQTFAFMGDIIRYRTEIGKRWETMSTDERHRVMRGTKEILIIIAMGILVSVLGGADDKKELQDKSAIQNWALSVAMAVKAETETFVPFPGMGLNEMARKMNSPFAAVRQVSNILKVLQNLSLLIIGSPDAYYKSTSYKDGFHDKGDAKVVANLLKLIGWSGVGFDPVEKAIQQRNLQTLR